MRNLPLISSRTLNILLILALFIGSALLPEPVSADSTITVATTGDNTDSDGLCSLREAIINANNDAATHIDCVPGSGNDTIQFNDALGTSTITLGSTLPNITDTDGLTINGGGDVTLSGADFYRIFTVLSGLFRVNDLTLTHAKCDSCSGAGIYANQSTLIITNSIFSNNTATQGAGIYASESTLAVIDSLFSNSTGLFGGGIMLDSDSTVNISNSTFSGNSGISSGGGGAIYNSGTLNIQGSTFSNNVSPGAARGSIYNNGTATISNSTFSGNLTSGSGACCNGAGAIYNQATLTIKNSTFSGNGTDSIGGGGDLYQLGTSSVLNLYNNIFANAAGNGNCNAPDGVVNGSNNLIEDAASACDMTDGVNGNIVGDDPSLGPLIGSPAYFPLMSGSVAIDAGDDAICAAPPVNNSSQDEISRPQGSHCEMGSFEYAGKIDVTIGGVLQETYILAPGSSERVNYNGLDSGPMVVGSINGVNIISGIRDAWAVNGVTTSFSQLMGLPLSQVSDKYVFPAYNNVTLNEQLRIGNVNATDVPSTVTVTIGGVLQGTYTLEQNEAIRINYAGLDSGPVVVDGTDGVNIIAAIREAWAVNGVTKSFVQLMGLPASQLSNKYVFPAYNNVTLNEQLRIGNVNATNVPSTVNVTIGGVLQGTYTLQQNEAIRINYAGLDSGPVVVEGTPGVNIIAAIRDAWAVNGVTTSFSQLMGMPAGGLSDQYIFPAYNNVALNEQLRIGNVNVTNVPTTVNVTIGGVLRGTYTLQQNEAVRINYAGLDSGPVVVQGTPGVKIIAAIRDAWAVNGVTQSFIQLMGLPFEQLSTTYLFPAYNNVTLNEQLRFAIP